MNVLRSLGCLLVLSLACCGLTNAGPNLLRGRRARGDSGTGGLGSAFLNDIADRIEKLLSKLNTIPDKDGDEEWYEFYDDNSPIGNYTLNVTSTVEDIGNYTIQRNTSILIMQLSNGSKALVMAEELQDADAENVCGEDTDCGYNRFCADGYFYGAECQGCIAADDDDAVMCSRHGQCCDDAVCYLGRCTNDAIERKIGAACTDAGDCDEDMCCAAIPGSILRVCKPLARISETCDTGYQSWLNSILDYPPTDCPCEGSLTCLDVGLVLSHNICIEEDRVPQQNSVDFTMDDTSKLRFNAENTFN